MKMTKWKKQILWKKIRSNKIADYTETKQNRYNLEEVIICESKLLILPYEITFHDKKNMLS